MDYISSTATWTTVDILIQSLGTPLHFGFPEAVTTTEQPLGKVVNLVNILHEAPTVNGDKNYLLNALFIV